VFPHLEAVEARRHVEVARLEGVQIQPDTVGFHVEKLRVSKQAILRTKQAILRTKQVILRTKQVILRTNHLLVFMSKSCAAYTCACPGTLPLF